MYVSEHMWENTLRVPEEDEELEIIQLLVTNTIPKLNIIGCYLDGESRSDNMTIERVWSSLTYKVEGALGRGEGVIIMGDMNRPLQTPRPSFGTKLLMEWEESGIVSILNKK